MGGLGFRVTGLGFGLGVGGLGIRGLGFTRVSVSRVLCRSWVMKGVREP